MLDRLTLDQLCVLIAVAETGSLSAAARQLRRAQSAVSQSVQALEATLSVTLFDRAARIPKLTEAGLALLAEPRKRLPSIVGAKICRDHWARLGGDATFGRPTAFRDAVVS